MSGLKTRVGNVVIANNRLTVDLSDGRTVSVPISWYPRLSHALPEHRNRWELIGQGHGIHWPALDEDISVENILFGQPSGEGASSFAKWQEWYRTQIQE
jgi:hypothetical protein